MATPSNPQELFPPYDPHPSVGLCPKCGNAELTPQWSKGPQFVFGFGTINGEHLLWRCRCSFAWVTETLDNTVDVDELGEAFGPTDVYDLDNLGAPPDGIFAKRPEKLEPVVPCAICGMDVRAGLQYVKGPLAGYAFCDDHEIDDGMPAIPQFASMLALAKSRVRYLVAPGQGYETGRVTGNDGAAIIIENDDDRGIVSRDPRRVTVLR